MHAKEQTALKGVYTITIADVVTEEARRLMAMIEGYRERGDDPRQMKRLIDILNHDYGHKPIVVENLIPTVGRSVLAQRLANTLTYTGVINKVALGTGSTPPANGDTRLTTEVYRNNASSLTYANNIAYITGFFTAAECNGTYNEAGLFIDGAAGANTGQLFSHVLVNVSKSSVQTLTIDWTLTIN